MTQCVIDRGDCCPVERTAFDSSDHFRYALPCEVPFQIAENIPRAETLVFDTAPGFDGNELLVRSRVTHAECCSNRGSADEGANLEDTAGANFCEVVNENQHVQMQHRIFVANFKQV